MSLLVRSADHVISAQEVGEIAAINQRHLQGLDPAVIARISAGNISTELSDKLQHFKYGKQTFEQVIQTGDEKAINKFIDKLSKDVRNPPKGTTALPAEDVAFLTHNSFRHLALVAAAQRKFVRNIENAVFSSAENVDVAELLKKSKLDQHNYNNIPDLRTHTENLLQWRAAEIDRLKQTYMTNNPGSSNADALKEAKKDYTAIYAGDATNQSNALGGRAPSTVMPEPSPAYIRWTETAVDKAKHAPTWVKAPVGAAVVGTGLYQGYQLVDDTSDYLNYNDIDEGLNFDDLSDIEDIGDAKDESANNGNKRAKIGAAFSTGMTTLNERVTAINNDLAPLTQKSQSNLPLTADEQAKMTALIALKSQADNIRDAHAGIISPAFSRFSDSHIGHEQDITNLPNDNAFLSSAIPDLQVQREYLQEMYRQKTDLDTYNRKIETARLAAIGSTHTVPSGLDAPILAERKKAEDAQEAAQTALLSSAATAGSPAPDLDKAKEAAKKNIEAAALLNERMAETAEKYGTITTHASGSKSYTGLHERINNAIDSYTNAGKTDDADRMRELQKELATFTASLRTDYISKGAGLATAISTRGGQVESATEKSVANTFLADQGALVKELSGLNTALNSKYAQFETDLVTTPKPAANKASAGAGGSGDTDEESEQKTETALQKQAEEDAKKTPEERLKLYQGRIAAAEKQSTDYVKQAELYANNLNNMIEEVQGFKDRTDARGESNPDADEFLVALEAYKEKLTEQQNNITAQHDKIVEAGKSVAKSTVDTVDEAQILSEDSARDIRSAYRSGQKIVAIVGEAEEDLHEIARRNPGMGNTVKDYLDKMTGSNGLGGGTGFVTRMGAPGPGGGPSVFSGALTSGVNGLQAIHHTFAYDLKRDVAGDTTAENWYMAGEVGMWTFGAFAAIALINNVVPGVTIDGGMKWLMVGAAVIYALHATGETGKDFEQLASYKKYKEHNWADNKAQGSGQNLISGIKNNGDNVSMNIHSQKTGEISGTVNLYESGKYVAQSQDGKTITGIITDEAMKTQISAVSSGNGANLPPEIKQFFSALDNVSHGSNGVEERRDLTFQPAANNDTYNVRAGNTG